MEEMCKRLFWGALPLAGLLIAGCGGKFVCGDGVIETDKKTGAFETCDDGNTTAGDGCDDKCQVEFDAQNHLCTLPTGFKNGFGGCCNSDADCLGGGQNGRACADGVCTTIGCTQDADCNNALNSENHVASPFPDGTTFKCVNFNNAGIQSFCLPGSGTQCDRSTDGRCPTGETCTIAFTQDLPTDKAVDGFGGVCTTDFLGSTPPGGFCDPNGGIYQCSEGVVIFNNCIGNTCTSACDGNNSTGPGADACNDANLTCVGPLGPLDLSGNGSLFFGGAGFCTGLACGLETTTNNFNDENIDVAACGAGFACDFFGPLSDTDTNVRYQCQAEDPNGADTYQPCQQDRFFEKTCADASQCLEQAPAQDTTGAACATSADCCPNGPNGCNVECVGADAQNNVAGNCSPIPPDGFCSKSCADTDACVDANDPGAICVDLGTGIVQLGLAVTVPACFPSFAEAFPGATACTSEADCAAVTQTGETGTQHEGCLPIALSGLGDRALGGICADAATPGDQGSGTACSKDTDCTNGEDCVGENPNNNTQGKCTKTAAEGAACNAIALGQGSQTNCTTDTDCTVAGEVCAAATPGGQGKCSPVQSNCLSGLCADHDGNIKLADNSPSNTFCSSLCSTSTDCGADETCRPILTNDNNTAADGSDDTVIGLCEPIVQAGVTACTVAATDCGQVAAGVHNGLNSAGNAESCDGGATPVDNTGACFTGTAVNGDDCKNDDDCALGANCIGADATNNTDGFCVLSGCDPNGDGSDCGDANSECVANGTGAPGLCVHKCAADADCTANGITTPNANLTCQDTNNDGTKDGCLLP